jgi:hypothetical protein
MPTADVTFEEAKICPKCKQPGEQTHVENGPRGSKIHTITCKTAVCTWFETGWVVQVLSDGTIPVRESGPRGQDKDFAKLSPDAEAGARRYLEQLKIDEAAARRDR